MNTDYVGENIQASVGKWTFGNEVPLHFSEHVRRSVPFYDEGHIMALKISDFFIKSDSTCYELGVSTGSLIKKLADHHKRSVRWIGIDKEQGMIAQAEKEIKEFNTKINNVELVVEDLKNYQFDSSDFIASYYTMQFTNPRERQEIFNKIYESLNWGGGFLLFEKVRGSDARFQDILTSLYQGYKLDQGYTPSEIIAKSNSLKGVLEPFSTQGNTDLLRRAGFVDIQPVFQYLCFQGLLAIK